jgi:hypothetical protein
MDIVENCRGSNSIWHADNYGSSYSAPCYGYVTHSLPANTTDFHVYGLKWDDSTGATFYYDGVADWNLPTTKAGSYTGAVRLTSEQATLGSVMKIEYVRYYKDMGPTTACEERIPATRSLSQGSSVIKTVDGSVTLPNSLRGVKSRIIAYDIRGKMVADMPIGSKGVIRLSPAANRMMLVRCR